VTRFGMSDNIGVVCYDDDDDEVFIGRDLAHAKSHSELISGEIDKEVKEIIDRCYARAKEIILENMEILHKSADLLYRRKRLRGRNSKRCSGRRNLSLTQLRNN